jgi:hypothetical protein
VVSLTTVLGAIAMVLIGWHSDRSRERHRYQVGLLSLALPHLGSSDDRGRRSGRGILEPRRESVIATSP